jgi:uncharacterized protein (DUF433 family)
MRIGPGEVVYPVPWAATSATSFLAEPQRYRELLAEAGVMGGVSMIRGLRIPVVTVVSMVADGMTVEEICRDLPVLLLEDVSESLRYAGETVRERQLPLRSSA